MDKTLRARFCLTGKRKRFSDRRRIALYLTIWLISGSVVTVGRPASSSGANAESVSVLAGKGLSETERSAPGKSAEKNFETDLSGGAEKRLVFLQPQGKKQADPPNTGDASAPKGKGKPAPAEGLPKYEDMIRNIPTVKELITGKPVDWIVTTNDRVIVVEPVSPRPNTLEKIKQRIEESRQWPRPRTAEEQQEQLEKRKKLQFLYVTLPDDESGNPEYRIHHSKIRMILHHEDLLLRRIGLLQDEGQLALAFELLFKLKRRKPNWPGLPQYEKRQLMAEARHSVTEKQWVSALVALEELHTRQRDYPGLSSLLGQVVEELVRPAVEQRDYRRARHYLGRLFRREPQHAVYLKWEKTLRAEAAGLFSRARQAAGKSRHDEAVRLIEEAADIWPDLPGLSADFDRFYRRFQRLHVGVRHFPGESPVYFLPTLADDRQNHLTRITLFEQTGLDDVAHYQSLFFDEWIPTDLGRRTVFRLQRQQPSWQPQEPVTAARIAANLRMRLEVGSPLYDERLRTYLQSFRVISPWLLELQFSRVPPRLESILRFPLYVPQARSQTSFSEDDSETPVPTARSLPLLSARFTPWKKETWSRNQQIFRRNRPEPDEAAGGQYHIAEVIEHRFTDEQRAIQALKRNQIQVLAHVSPFDKDRLAADNRIKVRQYAVPQTHLLQFNPASAVLLNREFRRALTYSLNRRALLDRYWLRTPDGGDARLGRVVSGPFPQNSYAYDTTVKPKQYDIALALALTLTIKRQYQRAHTAALGSSLTAAIFRKGEERGWLPTLRLLVPPGEKARQVAEALIGYWKRIGLRVELVEEGAVGQGELPRWDMVYRIVKMRDPVVDLWPLLTMQQQARVEGLRFLPDWLRQELIRLETARDWKTAVDRLQTLHRHLAEENLLIPLWEVDDFLAVRYNVDAFPEAGQRPAHLYQSVEQWQMMPLLPPLFP